MQRSSTTRNVLSGFLGWLLPLICTFLFTPVILHGLGMEAYGLYTLVVGVIGYMASFNFNIGRGITRFVSSSQALSRTGQIGETLSAAFLLYLGIGLLTSAGLALSTEWIVDRLLQIAPDFQLAARLSLYLGAAGIVFTLLSQLFSAVPQALQRFDLYSSVMVVSGIAAIGGNGLMVWLGFDFPALIGWSVFVSAITCAIYTVISHRLLPGVRPTVHIRGGVFGELFRFGGAVTVYQAMGNLILLFERVWVTRELGPAALTYFAIPMTIATYIHGFIASLTQVIFPMVSEVGAVGNRERLYAIYTRALKYVAALVGFIALVLFFGSLSLLARWLGGAFAGASSEILKIHVVTFSLMALLIVPWHIVDGLGFPKWNAFVCVLWLAIEVPLVYWMTPRWGVAGVAMARLIAVLVSIPVYLPYVEKRVFGRILWDVWGRILLSVGLAGTFAVLVFTGMLRVVSPGWIGLAGSAIVSVVALGVVLWGIGYLDSGEKEWLMARFGHARQG